MASVHALTNRPTLICILNEVPSKTASTFRPRRAESRHNWAFRSKLNGWVKQNAWTLRETPKPWSRTRANMLAGSTSPDWPQLKMRGKKLPTIRVSLEAVACPRPVGVSGAKLTGKVKQTPTQTVHSSTSCFELQVRSLTFDQGSTAGGD